MFVSDARHEMAYQRRLSRHKAQYSLDCDDGIEYSACLHEPTPQELLERMELFIRLWNALNSLPEIQGRRIDAHIILGKSIKEIAEAEGVHEESGRLSLRAALSSVRDRRPERLMDMQYKKSSKSFQTYCLYAAVMGGGLFSCHGQSGI